MLIFVPVGGVGETNSGFQSHGELFPTRWMRNWKRKITSHDCMKKVQYNNSANVETVTVGDAGS